MAVGAKRNTMKQVTVMKMMMVVTMTTRRIKKINRDPAAVPSVLRPHDASLISSAHLVLLHMKTWL